MSRPAFIQRARVDLVALIEVNEAELGALHDLVGYGTDAFLKVFYEKLGQSYMQKHEAGLRSLFERIKAEAPAILDRVNDARDVFDGRSEAMKR